MVMSVPLFLSFQLKRPPDFLEGIPFILLWTWGVLATIAVPVFIAAEVAYCLLALVVNAGRPRAPLTWHALALIVATLAYVVFRVSAIERIGLAESAMKLHARTVSVTARPGNTDIHHASRTKCWADPSCAPQSSRWDRWST